MRKFDALTEGLRRLGRGKRYVLLIYLLNLIIAVAIGASLAKTVEQSLGSSAAAENMLRGHDDLWSRMFANEATGIAQTFDPTVTGIGAVFNGLDAFLQGKMLSGESRIRRGQVAKANIGIVAVGFVYLLMWTFFSGGLISTYAAEHERPPFLQESARFFLRLLILGLMAGVIYVLMFKFVFRWLTDVVDEMTRETIDERVHFTYTAVKYLLFWFAIWGVNLIFDYAKILTVVQDRLNVFTAPLRAFALVLGNLFRTYGLYLILGSIWLAFMLFYWIVAPDAGQSSWTAILGAFLVGQLYILSRIATRCWFYSSQTAMYQALASNEMPSVKSEDQTEQLSEQQS